MTQIGIAQLNKNPALMDKLDSAVVILPLSSQIRGNEFTYFLKKQEKLEKDSVIVCNAIKMIDADRLLLDKGVLLSLTSEQIIEI